MASMNVRLECTLQPGFYVDGNGLERECIIAIIMGEEHVYDAETRVEVVGVTAFATGPPE